MPRLLRLLAINAAFGFALGTAIALAVVAINVGGIGDVLAGSDSRAIGYVLLAAGFGLTFASLAMGGAVMMLNDKDFD